MACRIDYNDRVGLLGQSPQGHIFPTARYTNDTPLFLVPLSSSDASHLKPMKSSTVACPRVGSARLRASPAADLWSGSSPGTCSSPSAAASYGCSRAALLFADDPRTSPSPISRDGGRETVLSSNPLHCGERREKKKVFYCLFRTGMPDFLPMGTAMSTTRPYFYTGDSSKISRN
jgi:hypothetical protein